MAKDANSPSSQYIPNAIVTLMQAFQVDSEETARSLVMECANAIALSGKHSCASPAEVAKEAEKIISFMRSIQPRDALEALYAAQIIVCNTIGMRKLSCSVNNGFGMKMLRFSNESMMNLMKLRERGKSQIEQKDIEV